MQPDSPSRKQHLHRRQSSSSCHTCWTPCCSVVRPQLSASCCHSASLLAHCILLGRTRGQRHTTQHNTTTHTTALGHDIGTNNLRVPLAYSRRATWEAFTNISSDTFPSDITILSNYSFPIPMSTVIKRYNTQGRSMNTLWLMWMVKFRWTSTWRTQLFTFTQFRVFDSLQYSIQFTLHVVDSGQWEEAGGPGEKKPADTRRTWREPTRRRGEPFGPHWELNQRPSSCCAVAAFRGTNRCLFSSSMWRTQHFITWTFWPMNSCYRFPLKEDTCSSVCVFSLPKNSLAIMQSVVKKTHKNRGSYCKLLSNDASSKTPRLKTDGSSAGTPAEPR